MVINCFNYFYSDPYEITEVRGPSTDDSTVSAAASLISGQLQRILDFDTFQKEVTKKLVVIEKRLDRNHTSSSDKRFWVLFRCFFLRRIPETNGNRQNTGDSATTPGPLSRQ